MSIEEVPIPSGPRIKVPEGKSLIGLVKSAMVSGEFNSDEVASISLGINVRTYNLVRKLLTLKERDVLSKEERYKIDRSLDLLEHKRAFREAVALSHRVLNDHWPKRTRIGIPKTGKIVRARNKTKDRIENTVFAIREACSNNDEVEVPNWLTMEERLKLRESLIESMNSLWKLFNAINVEKADV